MRPKAFYKELYRVKVSPETKTIIDSLLAKSTIDYSKITSKDLLLSITPIDAFSLNK